MNFYIFNQFPIPRPTRNDPRWQRIVQLAGRLASIDKRYANWAVKVGVEFGALPPDEKEDMIHEIDAVAAHLYGLNEAQLIHIFETFHENWDSTHRRNEVLTHFRNWNKVSK